MHITRSILLVLVLTSVTRVICQNVQDVIKSIVPDINPSHLHRLINFLGRERPVQADRPITNDITMVKQKQNGPMKDMVNSNAVRSELGSRQQTEHGIGNRPGPIVFGRAPEPIPRPIGSANQVFTGPLSNTGITKHEHSLGNPNGNSLGPVPEAGKSPIGSTHTEAAMEPIKPLTGKQILSTAGHTVPISNSATHQTRPFPLRRPTPVITTPQSSFRTYALWKTFRLQRFLVRDIKRIPCRLANFNVRCFYEIPIIRVLYVPVRYPLRRYGNYQ